MQTAMKRKLLAAVVIALVAVAAGITLFGPIGVWDYYRPISFTDVQSERAVLIDGIESYQDVARLRAYLAKAGYTAVEKTSGEDDVSSKRPPFRLTTLTIEGYTSEGFPGRLSAVFFNDRLMSTIFYPSEPDRYLEYVGLKHGIVFDSKGRAEQGPYTAVSYGADHRGRKFVIWEDVRLRKENEIWILRYS